MANAKAKCSIKKLAILLITHFFWGGFVGGGVFIVGRFYFWGEGFIFLIFLFFQLGIKVLQINQLYLIRTCLKVSKVLEA